MKCPNCGERVKPLNLIPWCEHGKRVCPLCGKELN